MWATFVFVSGAQGAGLGMLGAARAVAARGREPGNEQVEVGVLLSRPHHVVSEAACIFDGSRRAGGGAPCLPCLSREAPFCGMGRIQMPKLLTWESRCSLRACVLKLAWLCSGLVGGVLLHPFGFVFCMPPESLEKRFCS